MPSTPIEIRKTSIEDALDLTVIEGDLRAGKILFLETKRFFAKYEEDILLLKKSIDSLQNLCLQAGGGVARIGEDILVLNPHPNISF